MILLLNTCVVSAGGTPMLDVDGLAVAGGMRLGFHMHDSFAFVGGGGAVAADSENCRDSWIE